MLQHIKSGKLRPLAVTGAKRSPVLPEVPTMAEAGVPDQEGGTPQGILVPKGAPKEVSDLLYRETVRVIALPEIREKLAAIGFEPIGSTPAEFSATIRRDIERWTETGKKAGLRAQ